MLARFCSCAFTKQTWTRYQINVFSYHFSWLRQRFEPLYSETRHYMTFKNVMSRDTREFYKYFKIQRIPVSSLLGASVTFFELVSSKMSEWTDTESRKGEKRTGLNFVWSELSPVFKLSAAYKFPNLCLEVSCSQ